MSIPWSIPDVKPEDITYVKNILDSGWYTMGKQTKLLEEKMAEYIGVKHAIAVNNGTAALEVMLRAQHIGPGDEVIVPAFSYIATATAVSLVGATPVFVDVDKTMTIHPDGIDDVVSKKTKAVIAVDLTGSPCDYDNLLKKCDEHNISLLVDGAQSLGSTYKNKSCISYGLMGTTSFHAAKILTTVEGGMIFTDDEKLADTSKAIRSHGEGKEKYVHTILGSNYRITDINAGFAIKQIERYEETLREREKKVDFYKHELKDMVHTINIRKQGRSCHFIFPILCDHRDELSMHLKKNGIDTRKIYPMTIPQQPIYHQKKQYPTAEWFCKKTLSLPLYAELQFDQIQEVCNRIKEFVTK